MSQNVAQCVEPKCDEVREERGKSCEREKGKEGKKSSFEVKGQQFPCEDISIEGPSCAHVYNM